MKSALSQPPTSTQEPVVVDDRASKIYKTVEPVPTAPTKPPQAVEVVPADPIPAPAPPLTGGNSDIGLEMFEKLKLDLENLKQKKSISSI